MTVFGNNPHAPVKMTENAANYPFLLTAKCFHTVAAVFGVSGCVLA